MDPTICVGVTWHDSIPSAVPDPCPRFFRAEREVEEEVAVVIQVARDGNETTDDDDEEDDEEDVKG